MPSRKKGRQIALQILYQADWVQKMDPDEIHDFACKALEDYQTELAPSHRVEDPGLKHFILNLITGVLLRREQVDQIISRFAKGWKLDRMAMVDRNILRLGIFELCYDPDIPPKVAINEAVELAKKFGDANSPSFINGIMDSVYRNHCSSKIDTQLQPGEG